MLNVGCTHTHCCSQKQLAAERIAALLEDRRIREGEEEMHRAHMNQQLEVAADKLRRVEEQLRMTTKDYILGEQVSCLLFISQQGITRHAGTPFFVASIAPKQLMQSSGMPYVRVQSAAIQSRSGTGVGTKACTSAARASALVHLAAHAASSMFTRQLFDSVAGFGAAPLMPPFKEINSSTYPTSCVLCPTAARRDKQGAEEMAVACEAALLEERTRTAEEVGSNCDRVRYGTVILKQR